ncbi:regulatory signaling modulator protein AmpE [Congregibacter variabilis]|uniref:Regulatory signaling modulator protein AmpE n=1 Tax=Congregibacter variabilis TaxID=3081200 RepID=A0ABZ0I858_9GAMM|nr:regulatory signaling modulator protein AmpE [Congregibacter sp. IMCC43200]
MTFLAMIIALSLQQIIQPGNFLQRDRWLIQWDGFVALRFSAQMLRLVITLGVIAAVAYWALSLLEGWLFGLVELIAISGLFVWSLGRADFHTALEQYEARASDDPEAARAALEDLWAPVDDADTEPADRALQRLVYCGYARWFAPLFYFVLAGPIAAVLYRAVAILAANDRGPQYLQVLRWADWIPARILGLTFALSGDFMAVSQRAPLAHFTDTTPAPQLLWELAAVACNQGAGARIFGDILYRSAGLWLLGLSAVLILG